LSTPERKKWIEEQNYPKDYQNDLTKFKQMIDNKFPQLEIDNESSRLKEKYGLGTRLNQRGYKQLKKILDKFWTGKRLDDQELTLAYVLCPKIILYEEVKCRVLDMVAEIEQECKQRWGDVTPPLKPNRAIKTMTEKNPDCVSGAISVIDVIWKDITIEEAIEQERLMEQTIDRKIAEENGF